MSGLFASRPGATEKIGVSAASAFSTAVAYGGVYRIYSNRSIHFKISGSSDATISDLPVYENTSYSVVLASGEKVAIITATGETSGDAWITYEGQR